MVDQTYSSKNGIVENNILSNFKGVLLRLKHSRKKVKVNNKTPFYRKILTVFADNIESISY